MDMKFGALPNLSKVQLVHLWDVKWQQYHLRAVVNIK